MRISFPKILLACVLIGGTTFGIATLRGYRFVPGSDEPHRQILKLEEQNEALQKEIAAKQARVDDLKENPEHIRLIIEDQYKLVTPGSKNFVVQDGAKGDPPAKPPARP